MVDYRNGARAARSPPLLREVIHNSQRFVLFTVFASGSVSISFGQGETAVDREAILLELARRLQEISGVGVLTGYPQFPLSALNEPTRLNEFLSAMSWAVEQIKRGG